MESSNNPPAVFLVGNYLPDGQASMTRFAGLLKSFLTRKKIPVYLFQMEAIMHLPGLGRGESLNKWLGYLDKYIFGPFLLKRALRRFAKAHQEREIIVHICDHSNAVYLPSIRSYRAIVTCHDIIAIRAALGEFPGIRTGWTGKMLQKWVWKNLSKADKIICVSEATRNDLIGRLILSPHQINAVANSLDDPFIQFTPEAAKGIIRNISGIDQRMALLLSGKSKVILHVGNNAWYKNRDGVLRIFSIIQSSTEKDYELKLIIVGENFSTAQEQFIREHDLSDSIIRLTGLSDQQLFALYNIADVFLFPSKIEGFGWPPLEAQACGCPVVASDCGSLKEVLENSAEIYPVDDDYSMADAILRLLNDADERQSWAEKGFENCERFNQNNMAAGYLSVYQELSGAVD